MEVKLFKQAILNKSLPPKVILTGDECLLSIYIDQINSLFKAKRLNNINDYLQENNSKFKINKDLVYFIYDDELFRTSKSFWDLSLSNVIFVYSKLKKTDSFYKAFENIIVDFPTLKDEEIKGVIRNRISVNDDSINYLFENCGKKYFKCLSEAEKISIFDKESHQSLFNQFKKDGILCHIDKIGSYDFVNAITNKDKVRALELVGKVEKDDEVGQLSLIYTSLRNQLQVQNNVSLQEMNISESLYRMLLKKKVFTTQELVNILLTISSLLNKIKQGQLDPVDALYLLILRCL